MACKEVYDGVISNPKILKLLNFISFNMLIFLTIKSQIHGKHEWASGLKSLLLIELGL